MDEVDNCVNLPARASFFIGDSAIPKMVKSSTPAQQFSGLLFDVPASRGQCLPPISSLLKMKPKKEDVVESENIAMDENASPIDDDSGSETDTDENNENDSAYYRYQATNGSNLSSEDMDLDDVDEDIPQVCQEMVVTTSVDDDDYDEEEMEIIPDDEESASTNQIGQVEDAAGGNVAKKKERVPRGGVTNQWVPISTDTSIITSAIIPRQEADRHLCNQSPLDTSWHSQFRFRNHFTTPISLRPCPLPNLDWADSREVWVALLKKDTLYYRDPQFLTRHPMLQSRMRSILLEWLAEVCEVCRLHRETYYLACDFIDRFFTKHRDLVKQQLQLIGITSLFIAAKAEEIYPPKLSDFAYVTDGACSEEDIVQQELVVLKVLNWDLTPVTASAWLSLYLQLLNMDNRKDQEHGFIFPQDSAHAFLQLSTLLDLVLLDIGSLQFTYSTLATTAICHMLSENVALSLSGYQKMDISACYQWMLPFAMTVNEVLVTELRYLPNISPDDAHNIQMHNVSMEHLDLAQSKVLAMASQSRSSPDVGKLGVLTPPQSGKKCQESLL